MPDLPSISQIIRSKRKSFSLEVQPDGQLIVRAPRAATQADINTIVAQKASWIARARARQASHAQLYPPKTFTPGEKFWYLGQQYPLHLVERRHPLLSLNGAFTLAHHAQAGAKKAFIAWYRAQTRQNVQRLIAKYQAQHGFKVNALRITSARTRWGSCSGKGNLNFTYRLCMAPPEVMEYVVVHELAHLRVPNHSRTFWAEVARLYPRYQHARAWLKQHGHLLTLD
ncbi:MAG: M48 family metallopeptidase [Chloroflexi bacterium]|nr:M48 family metallopeptidase [Chloroflexota bacterium]